jgi:hypothetical protein
MPNYSVRKIVLRCVLMMILLVTLIAESGVTRAIGGISVSIVFDQTVATIGRTPLLTIDISSSESNPIRVTRLQCIKSGTSLTSNSINPMPSTIPANGFFRTQQLYRANTPGLTQVTCEFNGVDTVTGATVAATSNTVGVNVLSETRLYFDVTSSSQVATLGQAVYVIAKFGNRGTTPFTNLSLDCIDLAHALFFISQTPLQSTILPGQSGFVQIHLQAVQRTTGLIVCSLTATDSSNGQQITLPAPTLKIVVK